MTINTSGFYRDNFGDVWEYKAVTTHRPIIALKNSQGVYVGFTRNGESLGQDETKNTKLVKKLNPTEDPEYFL